MVSCFCPSNKAFPRPNTSSGDGDSDSRLWPSLASVALSLPEEHVHSAESLSRFNKTSDNQIDVPSRALLLFSPGRTDGVNDYQWSRFAVIVKLCSLVQPPSRSFVSSA